MTSSPQETAHAGSSTADIAGAISSADSPQDDQPGSTTAASQPSSAGAPKSRSQLPKRPMRVALKIS